MAENDAKNAKRFLLTMQDWTTVYTLLKKSTETTAPVLSRELKDACDLAVTRKLEGGFFDGPRSSAIQPDIETKKDASASSMRVRLLWSQPRALPRSSAIGTEAQSAQEAMIHVHATAPYQRPVSGSV